MLINQKEKRTPNVDKMPIKNKSVHLKKRSHQQPEEFKSLLPTQQTDDAPTRPPCRFTLYCVRKKECGVYKISGTQEFTFRGDMYKDRDPAKMMRVLLRMVMKFYNQHSMMILYDNSIPPDNPSKEVIKLLNNKINQNRLPYYADLIGERFYIPEWLSTET